MRSRALVGRHARRRIALERHRHVHVVALDQRRAGHVADRNQRAHRHQVVGRRAHLEPQDVVALEAMLLIGLGADLVDAAEGVEVVHIGGAEIDRQGFEDVGDRHVQHARLVAIDLEEQLGARGREGREHAGQAGRLIGLAHQLVGDAEDAAHIGAVAFLKLQLEAAGIADAADRRRRDRDDERLLDRLQPAEERSDDRRSPAARVRAAPRNGAKRANTTPALEALVKVAPENPAKATASSTPGVSSMIFDARCTTASVRDERRAVRQLDDDDRIALVERRDEAARHRPRGITPWRRAGRRTPASMPASAMRRETRKRTMPA